MKKILLIIGLFLFIPSLCWSQGRISRPKKKEPIKKEAPKQTPKTQKSNSHKERSSETNSKPDHNQVQKQSTLLNSTETINGITVKWASDVTSSQKSAITTLLNNMIYVQGGSFMMGSNESDAFDFEKPVHKETVSSFRIDKYEVTQKLWQAVMGNNPSHFKGENLPVEKVSWNDCQDFIKKLNLLTGLSFRMPTEAEWEYAARGGNLSKGYQYSGSNTIGNVAWYEGNSGSKTHPVGTKSPNELGLYDMSGNVWEWTSDSYSSNYNSRRNRWDYVYRGGNWVNNARLARVAYRSYHEATRRNSNLGFRLVL